MNTKLLLACLFLLCSVFASAQAPAEEEALLKEMQTQTGEDKLRTIFQLMILHDGDEKMLHYIDMMEQYARETSNVNFIGAALMFRATYYLNWGSEEDFLHYATISKEYSLANNNMPRYFAIESYIINSYAERGKYETALRTIDEMLEQSKKINNVYGEMTAYTTMGDVYITGGYYDKALEAYAKSYSLLEDWKEGKKNIHQLETMLKMAYAALKDKEYDKAREYCDILIKLPVDFRKNDTGDSNIEYSDYEKGGYVLSAMLYLQQGDTLGARESLNRAEQFSSNLNMINQLFNTAHAEYSSTIGEYDTALEYVNQAVDVYFSNNAMMDYIETLQLKAEILTKKGNYYEAYNAINEARIISDSLSRDRLATQISELRTIYQLDKLTVEKERQRIIALWAITGCVLLAVLALMFIIYSRRLRKKNLSLYKQINEQRQIEKEAETAEAQIPAEQLSRERKLYLALQQIMQTEKLFTNPDIDRNKLAEQLGTNRQYLVDAIAKETGLTFGNYIADLRLKYALELLSGDPNLTLEAVAFDSGHGSYSPFYRAFTQKYGINPSEYRKLAARKQ